MGHNNAETMRLWRAKNREKCRQQSRESARRYRDKYPDAIRKRKRLWLQQNLEKSAPRKRPDNCEISGLAGFGHANALHYDHCHSCGEFRGWIHGKLNRALGFIGDNPKLLRDLADYLEKHEAICQKRG